MFTLKIASLNVDKVVSNRPQSISSHKSIPVPLQCRREMRAISIYTYITYAKTMFNTTTYLKMSATLHSIHSLN